MVLILNENDSHFNKNIEYFSDIIEVCTMTY